MLDCWTMDVGADGSKAKPNQILCYVLNLNFGYQTNRNHI